MKFTTKIITGIFLCLGLVFVSSEISFARELPEGCSNPPCFKTPPPESIDDSIDTDSDIREVVIDIINYLLGFVGLIGVVAIIYFGFLWLTSAGNEDQIETGKKGIIWVGLGIILILLSYVIVDFFVGITTAGASGNSEFTTSELQVKHKIERMLDQDKNSDNFKDTDLVFIASGITSTRKFPEGCSDPPCFKPPPANNIDPSIDTDSDIREVVIDIINYLLGFVGLIGVVAIIYFGFLWLTSAGNEDQIETGKKGIIWVGLGIILILLSYVIVDFFVGITSAGARGNNEISTSELLVKQRVELLQDEIENSDGILTSQRVDQMYDEYNSVLDNLPATETTSVLKYYFSKGGLSNKFEDIGIALKQIQAKQLERESMSDELQIKQTEKDIRDIRNQAKSLIRSLLSEMTDLPRMQAEINVNPREGFAPATIAFSGLDSKDPMNTTIPSQNYHWSFVDHNGNEQDLGTGPTKVYTFTEPGSFVVRLEVITASGAQVLPGVKTITVQVFPAQTKADFLINGQKGGEIVKISLQEAKQGLLFDPSVSEPTDGTMITQYKWDFNGKKETYLEPKLISHAFSKEGKSTVTLEVSDNAGNESKKKVQLSIESSVAIIKLSDDNPSAGERVVFDGTRSSLDGGGNMRFIWRIYDEYGSTIDENNGNPQFTYVFDEAGKYEIELSIGNGIYTKKAVTVRSRPPVAAFTTESKSKGDPGQIIFNASQSRDPEGLPLTYSWDFDGDGVFDIRNSNQPIVSHQFSKKGLYTPRLVVTDSGGQSTSLGKDLQIETVLNAEFSVSPPVTQAGKVVEFRAQAKSATSYRWDFGDGEVVTTDENITEHTYLKNGLFQSQLLVTGITGDVNSYQQTVLVGDGTNPVATISTSIDGKKVEPVVGKCGTNKKTITLDRSNILELSASDSVNSSGGKGDLEYIWDFHDGNYEQVIETKKQYSELTNNNECEKITLTVREKKSGKTDTYDDLYIYVKNILPTFRDLKVVPQKEPCNTPCPVALRLDSVNDQDGSVVRYRWWAFREGDTEKIELHTTTSPETVITLPSRGPQGKKNTFYFSVDLFDNDGGQVNSSQILTSPPELTILNEQNPEPILDLLPNRVSVHVGDEVVFTSKLTDQGEVVPDETAYAWDFDGDGTFEDTFSGPMATHVFEKPGEYQVRLRVTVRGFTPTKTRTIFVGEKRQPPFAEFNLDQQGLKVVFDATNSGWDTEIPDNKLQYFWDFDIATDSDGNGTANDDIDAEGINVEKIYGSEGEFTAALRVENINGKSDYIQKSFLVKSGGGSSQHPKKTIRNAQVSATVPMAKLDVVMRYTPNVVGEPVELFVFASDLDGTLLNSSISFAIQGGEGDIISASEFLENGYGNAVILLSEQQSSSIINVSVQTSIGIISESISLPK